MCNVQRAIDAKRVFASSKNSLIASTKKKQPQERERLNSIDTKHNKVKENECKNIIQCEFDWENPTMAIATKNVVCGKKKNQKQKENWRTAKTQHKRKITTE